MLINAILLQFALLTMQSQLSHVRTRCMSPSVELETRKRIVVVTSVQIISRGMSFDIHLLSS